MDHALLEWLKAQPRLSLSTLQTPIERLAEQPEFGQSEVWIKRDDRIALPYGGNKVRKLEFLLGQARAGGFRTLLTTGAFGSHHVLATSIYGHQHGFGVHAVMSPQPWTEHVENNLRLTLAQGTVVHAVESFRAIPWGMLKQSVALRLAGKKPYIFGPGGSSPVGTLGFVLAGLECARQVKEGKLPEPEAVFVALGSAGSASGLALGLVAGGLSSKVIAVRVIEPWMANAATIKLLLRRTVKLFQASVRGSKDLEREAFARIDIDSEQLGAGYGAPTQQARAAQACAQRCGIKLELTYTAKAFAGMLDALSKKSYKRVLFWNTFNSASLDEQLACAPALPQHLREQLRPT